MDKEKVLNVLKEIKDIFNSHDIPIWAEYGTLLGIVRNKGIIPGDEDIDLGTFESYITDNLKKVLSKAFINKGYSLYYLPWTGVSMEKDHIKVNIIFLKDRTNSKNLVIDRIYKDNNFARVAYRLKTILTVDYFGGFKFGGTNNFRDILKINLFKILSYIPKKLKYFINYLFEKSIWGFIKRTRHRLIVPKKYFLKLKTARFEDLEFSIPDFTENYLKALYGEWESPPKDPKTWIWWEHGDWGKIEKFEKGKWVKINSQK